MSIEGTLISERILNPRDLFLKIRDIPFALGSDDKPEDIVKDNFGGCTRKHLYLAPRLKMMGFEVEIGIAQFDWRKFSIPGQILTLLKEPIQYHMFFY